MDRIYIPALDGSLPKCSIRFNILKIFYFIRHFVNHMADVMIVCLRSRLKVQESYGPLSRKLFCLFWKLQRYMNYEFSICHGSR